MEEEDKGNKEVVENIQFEMCNSDNKELFDYLRSPSKINCRKDRFHNDSPFDEIHSNDGSPFEANHSQTASPFEENPLLIDCLDDKPDNFSSVEVKDEKPDINTKDSFDVKVPVIENSFKIDPEEFKNEDDGDSLSSLTINDQWLGFGSLNSPEQLSGEIPAILGSIQVKSESETDNMDHQLAMNQPAVLTIKPEEDIDELTWPQNMLTTIQPGQAVNVVPHSMEDFTQNVPTTQKLTIQTSLANAQSFAGIAVPQNIVPCLSPEPADKNHAPQFFSPSTSLPALFEQTSPVITPINHGDNNNINMVMPNGGLTEIEDGNQPKRRKIINNGISINAVQSNSQTDVNFFQEYQQNARRRGEIRGYLEKQIQELRAKLGEYEQNPAGKSAVGKNNKMVVSGSESSIQPLQVNIVKSLTPEISIQTFNENNVKKTKIVRTIRKPILSLRPRNPETNFVHIVPKSGEEPPIVSNSRPKRNKKGKYDALIEKLKMGESLHKDRAELNNLIKIQDQTSTSNLDYLETEIDKIKSRLGIDKGGTSSSSVGSANGEISSEGGNNHQSGFNLNHQVPIVIAPKTSDSTKPIYMMGKVLKRVTPKDTSVTKVIPVSVVAGSKNSSKTAESLLSRSSDQLMSHLKNNSESLRDIRRSTNNHRKKRSRYESLTKELKNKQVENLQVFEKLKKSYKIAKTTGTVDLTDDSNPGSSSTPDSVVSLADSDDDDNDPRFKDDNYMSSFIKSFQSNPRRYKVYPEATQFRKHDLRRVTSTLPSPRVLNRRLRTTMVVPEFE